MAAQQRAYRVVDVFTEVALKGNPVAVVLDASGLDTAQMQAIANWTNLSETTFVLGPTDPAEADYRLRIFSPREELPFAGHPTLGSAHAILEAKRAQLRQGDCLLQECQVGVVRVSREASSGQLWFELPPAKLTQLDGEEVEALQKGLGVGLASGSSPAVVDVGPKWAVAQLESAQTVLELSPDLAFCAEWTRQLGLCGITVFGEYPPAAGGGSIAQQQIEVRSFAPADGIPEDPACGSGNGAVAAFRHAKGQLPKGQMSEYVASQGRCLGRAGRVNVQVDPKGAVRIGGHCVTCVQGTLNLH